MHRMILGLRPGDKRQVDHITHITLDNRRGNIRIVRASENQWNRPKVKGYCYHKKTGKYVVSITHDGRTTYLGLFATAKKARSAYLNAKKQYHTIGE